MRQELAADVAGGGGDDDHFENSAARMSKPFKLKSKLYRTVYI
jgi:hypothetical protein